MKKLWIYIIAGLVIIILIGSVLYFVSRPAPIEITPPPPPTLTPEEEELLKKLGQPGVSPTPVSSRPSSAPASTRTKTDEQIEAIKKFNEANSGR